MAWRWRPNRLRSVAMNIAQLGYTLPGLVLALGLLAPVLAIDNALNALAASLGRSLPGLIMVGSGAAVVIAGIVALYPWDIGPMRKAEARTRGGLRLWPDSIPMIDPEVIARGRVEVEPFAPVTADLEPEIADVERFLS